jgi:hypothetical protein
MKSTKKEDCIVLLSSTVQVLCTLTVHLRGSKYDLPIESADPTGFDRDKKVNSKQSIGPLDKRP